MIKGLIEKIVKECYYSCFCFLSYSHHLTVRKLAFRPVCGQAGYKDVDKSLIQLASCSLDYSVRIYNVNVDLL